MAIHFRKPKVSKKAVEKIQQELAVEKKQKEYSKKYPDEYVDEIPKKVIDLDEDGKWKLVLSCRRRNDDEEGLPYVDIRLYMTSEKYTGYTKNGFSISVLDKWDEFKKTIDQMDKEMHAKKGLF